MTLSLKGLFAALSINDTLHSNIAIMLRVVMMTLSIMALNIITLSPIDLISKTQHK